jgi:DNA-binding SARP family transcriptional activator
VRRTHHASHEVEPNEVARVKSNAIRRRDDAASEATASIAPLTVQLLGVPTLRRGAETLALPPSRKLRALVAYLALAPRPVGRGRLCELLWDVPNDPRGELRWCLSKLRGVLDEPGRRRVVTDGDTVALDLADCGVDARSIKASMRVPLETYSSAQLRALANLFAGEFLDGADIDRQPAFEAWLGAQRRRYRQWHIAVVGQLVRTAHPADASVYDALDAWLMLAPLDVNAHRAMFAALARHGRFRELDEHLAATTRLFDAENLDVASIRFAWRDARAQAVPFRPSVATRRPNAPGTHTCIRHKPSGVALSSPRPIRWLTTRPPAVRRVR